jgi:hypothetical protein
MIGQTRQWFLQAFHEPAQALQPLASRRDPLHVLEPPLNPLVGHGHRPAGFISRRKEPPPTRYNLFIRPRTSDIRIKPQQHVKMIAHHRETTDGHRKDFCERLEPFLKPLFAIVISFPQQQRAAHAACDAVVPAGQRDINELGASDRRQRSPAKGARITVRINSRSCEIDWHARRQ